MRLWPTLLTLGMAFGSPAPAGPRVLFIGNSYTYFNNLPGMVAALGRAAGTPIETRMIVRGGATLADHWKTDTVVAIIRRGGWTHVVLQEQSQLGNTVLINGASAISDDGGLLAAIRQFDAVIKPSGAKTVLFRHWSRRGAELGDRLRLAAAFDRIEDSVPVLAARVGTAWDSARRQLPDLELNIADASHPTAAGSYLSALVFYATITGRSPVGLPARLTGRKSDDEGVLAADTAAVLVDLAPAQAAKLQQIALTVTRPGYRPSRPTGPLPPLPSPPKVPTGTAPALASLTGTWVGRATIAPFPMKLEISVTAGSPTPTIAATIVAGQSRIGGKPTAVSLIGGHLTFVQPDGLNGLPMTFEGVMVGDSLTGVVRLDGAAQRLHAIGTWAVAKAVHR